MIEPGTSNSGSVTRIENASGTVINPATEDTLKLIPGLSIPEYDYVAVTYPSGTQEVYVFKTGGSGGATVATVTINYVDSTKANLLNVAKT